jgi:hypothetical protein
MFLAGDVLPDAQVYCVAIADALILGVLSSVVHQTWVVRVAPRLGVGNDIRWKPRDVWAGYPFPADDTGLSSVLVDRIRGLGEQIDSHRKSRQAAHADLMLTGIYNVLEKLRAGEPLSAKEREIYDHGLVGVLRTLHDELDAAVLDAYGWADLAPTLADYTPAGAEAREAAVAELLQRLVDLNARRAAEEAAGTVRWLRPEFQNPLARGGTQASIEVDSDEAQPATADPAAPITTRAWPTGLPEQIKAVSEVMAAAGRPLTLDDLAAHFKARGRWRDRLPTIVETLEAIGRARRTSQAAAPAWAAA